MNIEDLRELHDRGPREHHLHDKAEVKRDAVDHPGHYGGDTTYEHIKVVDAWGLNYRLGNATKYICRAGKKTADELEDLQKALWYLQSEIERVKKLRS